MEYCPAWFINTILTFMRWDFTIARIWRLNAPQTGIYTATTTRAYRALFHIALIANAFILSYRLKVFGQEVGEFWRVCVNGGNGNDNGGGHDSETCQADKEFPFHRIFRFGVGILFGLPCLSFQRRGITRIPENLTLPWLHTSFLFEGAKHRDIYPFTPDWLPTCLPAHKIINHLHNRIAIISSQVTKLFSLRQIYQYEYYL